MGCLGHNYKGFDILTSCQQLETNYQRKLGLVLSVISCVLFVMVVIVTGVGVVVGVVEQVTVGLGWFYVVTTELRTSVYVKCVSRFENVQL